MCAPLERNTRAVWIRTDAEDLVRLIKTVYRKGEKTGGKRQRKLARTEREYRQAGEGAASQRIFYGTGGSL